MGSATGSSGTVVKSIVRVVVSVLLLAWLLHRTDIASLERTLVGASWGLLLISLVLTTLCVVAQTARWSSSLYAMGAVIPFGGLLKSNFVGLFFNLFTPSNVGQDAARIIDFRTSGDSLATGLASVMIDRLLGMLAMLVFAIAAFPFVVGRLPDSGMIMIAIVVISVCLIVFFALLCTPAGRPLGRFAARFLPDKVGGALRDLYSMTIRMASKPRRAFRAVLWALVFQLLVVIANFAIAKAVGAEVSLKTLMLLVPLALLVSSIPISINGVGLREWAYVNLWGAFGVTREQAIVSSLVFFATWVAVGLIGAVVYLSRRRTLS